MQSCEDLIYPPAWLRTPTTKSTPREQRWSTRRHNPGRYGVLLGAETQWWV
jgi:hypothetical protein